MSCAPRSSPSRRRTFGGALVLAVVLGSGSTLPAIDLTLDRHDLARAVGLARWPHTDADRARFHRPYIIPVHAAPVDGWSVDRLEVITAFRRAELMAEDHARINDLWGRGSFADVEDALRPYRGHVTLVAHLVVRPGAPWVGGAPDATLEVDDGNVRVLDLRRVPLYGACGDGPFNCPLVGATIEAIVMADALGQRARTLTVSWRETTLAQETIRFGDLD
jgi:hypothetical protein